MSNIRVEKAYFDRRLKDEKFLCSNDNLLLKEEEETTQIISLFLIIFF
jgi:hypothetical protein